MPQQGFSSPAPQGSGEGGFDWGKWLPIIAYGAGTGLSLWEQHQAGKAAKGNQAMAFGLMQPGQSEIEKLLQSFGSAAPNSSQDGFMQYLTNAAGAGAGRSLTELSDTGSPFDNTELFRSLGVIDDQSINDQAMQLRAGAGSLGARFGSGFAQSEGLLRERGASSAAARRAGIAAQSYEGAQGRRLSALDMLRGTYQGDQSNQMAQRSQMLQALLGAGGLESQRRGYNAGLFGLGSGMQTGTNYGQTIANSGIDIATLLYILGQRGK
jgi:hypothetical protein